MVSKITLALKKRAAPDRGPLSSVMMNDFVNEVSHDLINIARQWNSIAYPIFLSLPQGEQDTRWDLDASLNPVVHGLDGTQIFMDMDTSTIIDDGIFWNSTDLRPKTLKEVAEYLKNQIDLNNDAIQLLEDLSSNTLTQEQKAKIGLNIFNPYQTSSSDSLDGRSKRNEFNITQLAKDLYGPTYALDGDGVANLVNPVSDLVDALLELHNGDWDTDFTLSHTLDDSDIIAAANIQQTKIDNSVAYSILGRTESPTDLEDDLNRLRYELATLRGNGIWDADFANIPYAGAPVSLQGHVALVGSGIPEATNPHGLTADDIGLTDELAAIVAFTGMDSATDPTPDFTSTNYINANDPLETAINTLDTYLKQVDDENDAHRAIIDDNPHGVDMLDFPPEDVITRINLAANFINADRVQTGSTNMIPTIVQANTWDTHLTTLTNAHPATAINVNDVLFKNFKGTTTQEAFKGVDDAFDERRLEIPYSGHDNENPIVVTHNRGRYPLVQLVDTSAQIDYDYLYTASEAVDDGGTAIYVNIEHLDENHFRVWTNSTDGIIIALF